MSLEQEVVAALVAVGGLYLLVRGRRYVARMKQEDLAVPEEEIEAAARAALIEFAALWDEGGEPVSMEGYWLRQDYRYRTHYKRRVQSRFVECGARRVELPDGSVRYQGSLLMRKHLDAALREEFDATRSTTTINIGSGAFAQFGVHNSAVGVSTSAVTVERAVEENKGTIDALVEILGRFAAATEARPAERHEASALGHELSVAQRVAPEEVPRLARRLRGFVDRVGAGAAGLAPLISAANSLLDLLQKAGLHA